jgi:Protein of unknown function (DUF3617)
MRQATLILAPALLLAACGSSKTVTAENASAADVAKQVGTSGVAENFVSPGHWQMTMTMKEMNIPGMPPQLAEKMKSRMGVARTFDSCVTPEEAKAPKGNLFAGDQAKNCVYEKFAMGGGKIDSIMHCNEGGEKRTMAMTGTYSAGDYHMQMSSSGDSTKGGPMAGMSVKMEMVGKRTGECTGKENG